MGKVTEDTGLSRELIHHYLRQGLLPRPEEGALYTDRQVRLLHQIKRLREDHNLPLDVMRRVFEAFDFDPVRIEPMTLAESLCKRMTRLAAGKDILSSEALTLEALIAATGVSVERVADYVEARLVLPSEEKGQVRYSVYDANIISLCERSIELGIPFESLRTIGSYVRVAFELEHGVLFGVPRTDGDDTGRILCEVFLRREVITSFIQNLLQARISLRVRELFAAPSETMTGLDAVVYRPSSVFLRRYGIDGRVESVQEELVASRDRTEAWVDTGLILVHAGRYREAVFFLGQANGRWPSSPSVTALYGRALILSGRHEQGRAVLEEMDDDGPDKGARRIFRALSLFVSSSGDARSATLIHIAMTVFALVDEALASIDEASPTSRAEVRMYAGWLLTTLPASFGDPDRGLALLGATLEEISQLDAKDEGLPGAQESLRINAAYLLFDAMARNEASLVEQARQQGVSPSPETLRGLVCRLDPGCAFAEAVFLAE